MTLLPRPPRRHPRRQVPGVHRPQLPAPVTPDEVLERAPEFSSDVSRETSDPGNYVAGGLPPGWEAAHAAVNATDEQLAALQAEAEGLDELARVDPGVVAELAAQTVAACRACTSVPHPEGTEHTEPPPPLSRARILKLEALTAQWSREVRVAGSPDDTLLYASAAMPPPPPPRPRPVDLALVPPLPDPEVVAEESAAQLAPTPPQARHRAPEPVPAEARLSDWTSRHDPRSLAYGVRQRLARAVPLQDVSLDAGPVLDQGTAPPLGLREASACVGMALATAWNVAHPASAQAAPMRETEARQLYELAQRHDHVHGTDYAGTSVLGGLLAGRELGLWDEFLWGLGGTKDVAQVLLQWGVAVVVGVPWSAELETPDAHGIIRPGGADRGGHAVAVVGLRIQVGGRPGPWFELQQSRGTAEGVGGRVFIHHRQLAQLLAGIGEAGVPLPRDLA